MEKFWPQPFKNMKVEHWSTMGDLAYFTTNFAPKIGHVFLE